MNRQPRLLLPSLALGLFAAHAVAQDPVDPPPWWGVSDDQTVSLSFTFPVTFPNGSPDPVPTFAVTPPWYNNPTPWTASGNIEWLANLSGHTGVLGITGGGSATLDLFVDNDPHLDWVKIFWFQFDHFEGASGEITNTIAESLSDYGRAAVTEETVSIGSGWERTTVSAELIPQPNDETIAFTFLENLTADIGIDNLHVSSKCVKPRPDEEGEALGKVMGITNLSQSTGGRECRALAVTRGTPTNPGRKLWAAVDGISPQLPIEILQLNALGLPTGIVTPLPTTTTQAPLGPLDMTVERIRLGANLFQEFVYVLTDRRPIGGNVRIERLDANAGGTLSGTTILQTVPLLPNQRLSMTFDPTGDVGAGSFWVAGPVGAVGQWRAFEYDRAGVLLTDGAGIPININVPAQTVGLSYDETLGNFYAFSKDPVITGNGIQIQCNGTEISGFTGNETGVKFCGDLTLTGAAFPPGGVASSMSSYRTFGGLQSELRFVCVVDAGQDQFVYEIAGPFRYGYSRFGTIGMQNGPPFLNSSFDVTLRGVPHSAFAMMFLGTGVTNVPLSPGIQAEAVASILPPLVDTGFLTPVQPGRFSFTIGLPNTPTLAYAETFYQWIVLDTTAPGFLGFTQAGKTVIYP